jgi:hypothetical protein
MVEFTQDLELVTSQRHCLMVSTSKLFAHSITRHLMHHHLAKRYQSALLKVAVG